MQTSTTRQRKKGLEVPPSSRSGRNSAASSDNEEHLPRVYEKREHDPVVQLLESKSFSTVVVSALTLLALFLRFYKISHPGAVVFDEVHFGKFASYYIRREYYFDVHPPFAKMMLGLAGWFAGFDGHFGFDNIGDSYTDAHVPYVGIRVLPALFGTFTVPLVFAIMKESGYPTIISALSASIVLFDNAHIAQSRLILLDAQLIFFTALSLYSYVRFKKLRYSEFTFEWWFWMIATGVSLASTLGSKMVGLFTFFTIGTAVLVDLWGILDHRKPGHTMEYFGRHFAARIIGLIIIPSIVYLSFFWAHFRILSHSGTGDTFMSPAFQETLVNNELLLNSQEIQYFDTVTIKHRDTKVFLHSHPERYPLRYEDGRVSSQGQQVTGYSHEDPNNQWQIIPTKSLPETGRGRLVRSNDVIQLLHVATQTNLLTHDVASPLMPTNQEFTTWSKDDLSRYNDTLFQVHIFNGIGHTWKSKSGHFKLIHMPTKVSLWTHVKPLPEWAFKQQEINGNKKASDKSTTWFVDKIVADGGGDDIANRTGGFESKPPKKMNFFKKFAELQLLMLQHNAGLTASHPYASNPINWPFSLMGISFWTQNEKKEQIYLAGNLVSWWACVMGLSIFVGVIGADLLARRRGIEPIPDPVRNRLWNNAGLFWIAWAYHYFPFYLMNRQLFLHHYLPAHLCSALVAGAVLNFVLSESINYPISIPSPLTRLRARQFTDLGFKAVAVVVGLNLLMISMFLFFAPLTYGTPGLDGDQVNRRRLLSTWTLHFAGKKTEP